MWNPWNPSSSPLERCLCGAGIPWNPMESAGIRQEAIKHPLFTTTATQFFIVRGGEVFLNFFITECHDSEHFSKPKLKRNGRGRGMPRWIRLARPGFRQPGPQLSYILLPAYGTENSRSRILARILKLDRGFRSPAELNVSSEAHL